MGKDIIVKSERIVSEGLCIAKLENGKILLIKGALPNETLRCNILKETKSYLLSEVKEIIDPSPFRRPSLCKYSNQCGGCSFSYIDYHYQLHLKKDIIRDNLKRIAKIELPDIKVIASDKTLGYRNRIRLQFKTGLGIGYFSQGSHRFIPIERCLLARAPIRKIMPYIFSFFKEYKRDSLEGQIELISPINETKVFCSISSKKIKEAREILEELIRANLIEAGTAIVKKQIVFKGKSRLRWPYIIDVNGLRRKFFIETIPGGFSQINWQQNLKVINKILTEAENIKCNTVLDLYSGFGNIAIPVSFICKDVIAVEQNFLGTKALKENIKRLGINNITVKHEKVERYIDKIVKGRKVELIILDPPRSGAKEVIKTIKAKGIPNIFYLSCSPTTFSRDIRMLLDYNYKIKEIIAYDFFPHTHHIELLIMLDQ